MQSERMRVQVQDAGVDWISAQLDQPDTDPERGVVLLSHGAGAPMTSEFMAAVAEGLVERGFPVLRFNYIYAERALREERRFPPDRRPRLLEVHQAALAALRERYPERRVVLAGKSMGGRMSTYLAAEGADLSGLALFGYPLHPPGKPEKLRSEHFAAIAQPALFLQGTRDALCDLTLLRRELETFGGTVTLEEYEDADHDFGVLKRTGCTREELRARLLERFDQWERATWP